MGAIKITLSIPEEMGQFLKDNPSISPSKAFQTKIEELQYSIKNNPQLIEALKTIGNLQRSNEILRRELAEVKKDG